MCAHLARTIQLGHLTTTLDSEADVKVLDTLAADDQDWLKDLVPQDLWADELQRGACSERRHRRASPEIPHLALAGCSLHCSCLPEHCCSCAKRGSCACGRAALAVLCARLSACCTPSPDCCQTWRLLFRLPLVAASCMLATCWTALLTIELNQASARLAVGDRHCGLLRGQNKTQHKPL